MMSKSARGAEAVLALAPLARAHPNLHVDIAYIASVDDNGTFHSLHGESEVEGDVWELCAIEHYQDKLQYLNFLVCLSQAYADIPENAEKCSTAAGLDLSVMANCVGSSEGAYLLNRSIQLSTAVGVDSAAETVIFVNGKRYDGALSQMGFEEALCDTSAVLDDDKVYEKWWFYFLLALGIVGGVAILIASVITAYRVYVKCHRASDMWLNMIKTNPGNALDFADKVQDVCRRHENQGEGGYGGPGAGVGLRASRDRGMEEGYARGPASYSSSSSSAASSAASSSYVRATYSVNATPSSSPEDAFEGGNDTPYYAEESPLLPSLGTTWSMGGLRD